MSENNATMSAEMSASAPAFGSDVKRLPLKDLLKRISTSLTTPASSAVCIWSCSRQKAFRTMR